MTTRLTKDGYKQLIKEDIEWLEKVPRTLERDHIIAVLRASVEHEYPTRARETVSLCPNGHPIGLWDANCDWDCIGK